VGIGVGFLRRSTKLNLALQGGGAHGAFTWGVLDRLLEEEDITIGWVSGTSAGAVNAAALAAGLAEGSREAARAKLRQVWEAVHKAGVPDLLRLNPFLYGLSQSGPMAHMASLWSPYDFNPLGFDPLRTLLGNNIDFAKIRADSPIELLIAATEIATGRARLFRRDELTVEAVLASACLPTLHRTVEIDGVGYWDGGFSANPDLVTLASESPVQDTLLVQITPLVKQGLPTGVREIAGFVNRLTFNAPLLRDIEVIEMAREGARGRLRSRLGGRLGPLVAHRFHLVEAGRYTASLSDESKMKPDLGLLTYLHGAGRTQMHKWLANNRAAIGKQSTVDLKARFLTVPSNAPDDETGEQPDAARSDVKSDGKVASPSG
jgi:NTE family protein